MAFGRVENRRRHGVGLDLLRSADLDLVYYGTSNPGPWNAEQRPGDNKFTSGLFARDASTGQARWFYQLSPHDEFDYDAVNESVLVDLVIDGKPRKVLVHPDRNGYVYVMDRSTGEVLSATPFVSVNTSTGVDLETGSLHYASAKLQRTGTVVRDICPASPGGKDWQPSAYSPRTQLLYIPHQNLCQDQEATQTSYIVGTPYVGSIIKIKPGPGGHRGLVTAWDPAAAKSRWVIEEDLPVWSGTLVTAGDSCSTARWMAGSRRSTPRTATCCGSSRPARESSASRSPIEVPDGKQYIAVLSGVGGWAGAVAAAKIDPRIPERRARFRRRHARSAGIHQRRQRATRLRSAKNTVREACARRSAKLFSSWRRFSPSAKRAPRRYSASARIRTISPIQQRRRGFRNKLAELLAQELGEKLTYEWRALRRGFVRNTLNADKCDVMMSVPVGYDLVETTNPYYRSSDVLVWRADRNGGIC